MSAADEVWKTLYATQAGGLKSRAHPDYLAALKRLDLPAERAPTVDELDRVVHRESGWHLVSVEGMVDDAEFFRLLSVRKFPVISRIRPPDQLDFAADPDLWHDVFGHVPFLLHPAMSRVYAEFGRAGAAATRLAPRLLNSVARLYWYTVEFGLVATPDGPRIYGAGILPSPRESEFALSGQVRRRPFVLTQLVDRPYRPGVLQNRLFVIESFEKLESELTQWSRSCLPGT